MNGFPFTPSSSSVGTAKARVLTAKFGDGYSQRTGDGIKAQWGNPEASSRFRRTLSVITATFSDSIRPREPIPTPEYQLLEGLRHTVPLTGVRISEQPEAVTKAADLD